MRLDGFGLLVNDMGKMIRFYRDVLGFEIKETEEAGNVYLVKDGTLFLLYGRKDFEGGFPRSCVFIPAVSDVDLKEIGQYIILQMPGVGLGEEQDFKHPGNFLMHIFHDFGHGFI